MEGMDAKDLKIMALTQARAEAEDKIIDLRVQLTLQAQKIEELEQNQKETPSEESAEADSDS